MSHSLRGLQDVISLGDWSQLQMQILILLCYLVVAGGIAWITSHIQHRETNVEQVSNERSYPVFSDSFFFICVPLPQSNCFHYQQS